MPTEDHRYGPTNRIWQSRLRFQAPGAALRPAHRWNEHAASRAIPQTAVEPTHAAVVDCAKLEFLKKPEAVGNDFSVPLPRVINPEPSFGDLLSLGPCSLLHILVLSLLEPAVH